MSRQLRAGREAGFALILALLALMMLTFLGMTLAFTTSTELQIATNYKWSQQALYNAEAGLDVARAVLMQVGDGQLVLPEARPIAWNPGGTGPWTADVPVPRFAATRNFEGSNCDRWGNGAGYGQVLVDPSAPGAPFQNVSTVFGQTLRGGFTVWIRREVVFAALTASDNPVGENITVTSEGSAPFSGAPGAFERANRAIRRLESQVTVREGCKPGHKETSDTGFDPCNPLPPGP